MYVVDVIPSRVWQRDDGRKASIYGSVPWVTDAEAERWKVVQQGWTWEMDNGTVGMCRVPAKTRAEAVEIAQAINERRARGLEISADIVDPAYRGSHLALAERIRRLTSGFASREEA